jgi:alcohol dehydrogenase class IV
MLDLNRMLTLKRRLVEELGLQSTLREYNVPKEDIPKIAQGLGGKDVEELLDGIY